MDAFMRMGRGAGALAGLTSDMYADIDMLADLQSGSLNVAYLYDVFESENSVVLVGVQVIKYMHRHISSRAGPYSLCFPHRHQCGMIVR
jgi:hypothetical protein